MKRAILEISGLKIYYRTRRGFVKAVDDVNLLVYEGETLGLIGESGCGKSTLGYSILRLLPKNAVILSGEIRWMGRNILDYSDEEIRRYRWKEVSMVFQGAMNALNPVMTVGDQIAEAIIEHDGVPRDEAINRAAHLLELTGIGGDRIWDYPHQLSGGMRQRVVIAMALALNPKLLIADEPVTALDVIVQAQILDLFKDLRKRLKLSIIFITHDLSTVADLSDRVAIMYAGKIVEVGDVKSIFHDPLHPYTKALLNAIPRLRGVKREMEYIPGAPPDLANPPSGCRFHPRCPYRMDICSIEEPRSIEVEGRRRVACHLMN